MLLGGYGLVGTWFVVGRARRAAPLRHPAARAPPATAVAGASFALLLALGFLILFVQLVPLARTAWERRHYVVVDHIDSWTGTHYQARMTRADDGPQPEPTGRARRGVPLASPAQLGFALAACVVALTSFFPQIIDASEVSNRYHHLDHAGQFFLGATARAASRLAARRLTPARRPLLARPHTCSRRRC